MWYQIVANVTIDTGRGQRTGTVCKKGLVDFKNCFMTHIFSEVILVKLETIR